MNKLVYILVGMVLGLFLWVGYTFFQANQPKPLLFQGEIEAQNYNISSKLPGRISNIYVKKGDILKIGDKVFSIYSPEVEAKLKQALAAKEAAEAKKQQAFNGARKEQIIAAKEQYEKAKTASDLLEKTYKRIKNYMMTVW